MTSPKNLKQGDKVGIVSPARKVTIEEIQFSINTLQSWGFEIVLGDNLFNSYHQYAGTDVERTNDFQGMLDDESVSAILCSRGGYGAIRIIDQLDFSKFIKHPKWIVGYSDITVLHSHIHTNFNIETLHSPMCVNFPKNSSSNNAASSLRQALLGEEMIYDITHHPLNRSGSAEGVLTGGNLSILYNLRGTNSDIDTNGKILFIEDVDEYLYHIDRMMMNFKRSGLLRNLSGLIVGSMSKMNDNEIPFGKTAEEIITESVAEYDFPVCFDFPAGHLKENSTLILGRKVKLNVFDTTTLKFIHKTG